MQTHPQSPAPSHAGQWMLRTAGLALLFYVLHTVYTKITGLNQLDLPRALDDVGEFLLVLFSMVLFVVGLLQREHSTRSQSATDVSSKEAA